METNLIYSFSMMVIGMVLIYLAIRHKMEPTLLLPMGFGAILANIPGAMKYSRFSSLLESEP